MELELCAGIHTVEFRHLEGTFVLDSALLYLKEDEKEISLLPDGDKAYLAVAPYDGYYEINSVKAAAGTVDGVGCSLVDGQLIYLRRGLNEISLDTADASFALYKADDASYSIKTEAADMSLDGKAELKADKYGNSFIDGISSQGGGAEFKVTAPEKGSYRVTLNYANNLEGGYHAYNVDLIEALITVNVNGEKQDVFCRSTYSLYNYNTLTFNVELEEGENTVTLSNSGNVLFAGNESFAPRIESLTFNSVN
jgi:hypothetical protein